MIIILLVLLAFLPASSTSSCSSIHPIALPVTNVLLSNGHSMRGIPIAVGTPPRNFSFMPHDYLNDTWVYNTTLPLCPSKPTQPGCTTLRGGLYTSFFSTSALAALDVYAAGGASSDVQKALGTHIWASAWVNDDLALGNITLPGFPLGMPGFDFAAQFDTQHNIGLGGNSTLLTALKASGHIASRSYSWWWGKNGANESMNMDGSIVFGGYDKAKTLGKPYTRSLIPPEVNCQSGMRVTISDLMLDFPNGTLASLLGHNQISACLQPDFTMLMTLAGVPYYDTFELLTQTHSFGAASGVQVDVVPDVYDSIDADGYVYDPLNVYQGALTISLNSAFSVSIPNDLFVVPPRHINFNGAISTDPTLAEVLIAPPPGDEGSTFILGRPFFSSTYLSVNYDEGTFTLWEANPTEDTDLVAFDGNCPSPPSNGTGRLELLGGTNHSGILATRSIVGIAVGCSVVGLVVLGLSIMGCVRRRRRKAEMAKADQNASLSRAAETLHRLINRVMPNEAMSSEIREMNAERDPQELAACEWRLELSSEKASRVRQVRLLQGPNSPVELP